jgi:hypothetical protein
MSTILGAFLFASALFLGMIILLEVGRRVAARRIAREGEDAKTGTGAIEGAVLALLGLLVAFTFSGAAGKFDVMLFVLALASAVLAGYSMAGHTSRSWLHIVGFAAVTALAVYIIIDLEYPRLGLIRVDAFDSALRDVRAAMGE